MNSSTYQLKPQACPQCHTKLSATTNLQADRAPQPGSFSVCVQCGAVLVFGPTLEMELATAEQVALAQMYPGFARQLRDLKMAIALRQMRN